MPTLYEVIRKKGIALKRNDRKLIEAILSGKDEFEPENPPAVDEKLKPHIALERNTISGKLISLIYRLAGVAEFSTVPRIKNAHIDEVLDLENFTINSPIRFTSCTFAQGIKISDSTIKKGIFLPGSNTPGILAERITVSGPIILRHGFKSTETLNFRGAKIEGDVDLCGAHCEPTAGKECMNLSSSIIRGNILLSLGDLFPYEQVKSKYQKPSAFKGTIKITNARIYGNVNFSHSRFKKGGKDSYAIDFYNSIIEGDCFIDHTEICGGISLWGVTIQGDIHLNGSTFKKHKSTENEKAEEENLIHDISADGIVVKGAIYLHNIMFIRRKNDKFYFSFNHAKAQTIADDMESWSDSIDIDGFHYETISKDRSRLQNRKREKDKKSKTFGTCEAEHRIKWLAKHGSDFQPITNEGPRFTLFDPQPWQQIREALRNMGHNEDARKISIALEEKLRETGRHGGLTRTVHIAYGLLTGYGYRPMRLMGSMLIVWLGCAGFYWFAALPPNDVFAPSNPLVFQHSTYQVCAPNRPKSRKEMAKPPNQQKVVGAGNWYLCSELREEYTGFSPLAYSLDVILPLVDLQQQKDWGPLIPTPQAHPWDEFRERGMKHLTRIVIWFETLFGWLASLLLVAIVSGLTKRRED